MNILVPNPGIFLINFRRSRGDENLPPNLRNNLTRLSFIIYYNYCARTAYRRREVREIE